MKCRKECTLWLGMAIATRLFSGCDVLTDNAIGVGEDLPFVTQVLSEGISDKHEGIIAELHDVTASLSHDELTYNTLITLELDRPWKGLQGSFTAWFDPATGNHTIHYIRTLDAPVFTKRMEATLQYIYRDTEGKFLDFPRIDQANVASIAFTGHRQVVMSEAAGLRHHAFERTATWLLQGFTTDILSLNGEQVNRGTLSLTELERRYEMRIQTVDVTIEKGPHAGDLENRVTGMFQFHLSLTKPGEGASDTNTHSGTIELNGQGSALLRIMGFREVLEIDLKSGAIKNQR